MIKVNNKKAINLLTKRTLVYNKSRNLIAIIAIAMTTFLLTTVFFLGMNAYYSYDISIQRYNGTTAHATFPKPSEKQITVMKEKAFIKNIGFTSYVAVSDQEEAVIAFLAMDKEQLYMVEPVFAKVHGYYPKKQNEIMLSIDTLKLLGVEQPETGMEITLPYQTDLTHLKEKKENQKINTFQLSGWYINETYNNHGNNYGYGYVTEEFASTTGNTIQTAGKMDIQFVNKRKAEYYTDILNNELNLTGDKKIQVYDSLNYSSEKMTTVIGIIIIVTFLIFSGYLLIYNIFYLSVSKDIRYYGLLKTIGTTRKQLTKIVMNQAIRLSIIGIPFGVLLGLLVTLVLVPAIITLSKDSSNMEYIKFYPKILLVSVIFSFITVIISVRKPSKMVGQISPVEAVSFTGITNKAKCTNKIKLKRGVNGSKLTHLAWRNVFRDKKRAFIVILSLILGLTTFVFVITIVNCIKVENYVNYSLDSDIQVGNSYVKVKEDTYELSNSIDLEIADKIKTMDGVKDVYVELDSDYIVSYDESYADFTTGVSEMFEIPLNEIKDKFYGVLVGIDDDMLKKYIQVNHIDIEAFQRGEIALIDAGFQKSLHFPKSFRIQASENSSYSELKFGGYIPLNAHVLKGFGYAPTLIVSKDFINQFNPNAKVKELYVYTQKGTEVEVYEEINKLTDNFSGIFINSKENIRNEMQFTKIILNVMGGGISVILAFIGIINYVNVMLSGVQVRSKELAVLESIGMTKKQIGRMLLLEGIYYGGMSLGFVWTIGNGLTYVLYRLFKETATYAVFDYPFKPILIVSLVVILICIFIPMITYGQYTKINLTSRLRAE